MDVPLDVSLCRWLLREYKAIDKNKEALLDELEWLLTYSFASPYVPRFNCLEVG